MIRKLIIATIAASAQDAYLQILLALLLLVVSLTLQAKFDPYIGRESSDILNHVETWSLFCLVLTQIISTLVRRRGARLPACCQSLARVDCSIRRQSVPIVAHNMLACARRPLLLLQYLYVDTGDAPKWMYPNGPIPLIDEYGSVNTGNPGVEPFVTAALLVINVGVVATITFLFTWSKLFDAHYNHSERTRFKCTKKQASLLFRCVKWTMDDDVAVLERRVNYTKAQVYKLWEEGEEWTNSDYTRTSHGIPIKEFHAAFLDKEIKRYTAHRAYELTKDALAGAIAARDADPGVGNDERGSTIDYSNPNARASMQVMTYGV